jgi:membrane protease YdiL (CAAX protease family)
VSDSTRWPAPDPAQWEAPAWPPPRAQDVLIPVAPLTTSPAVHALAYAPPSMANPAIAGWTGVFFRVRARWLLVFAIVGVVGLLVGAMVLFGSDTASESSDVGLATLFYLPLLLWVAFLMWKDKLRLAPFLVVPHIGRYWWTVLGMTVVLLLFSVGASSLTSLLFPGLTETAAISTDQNPVLLFVSLVVLPPLVEELLFRGVLLERWTVKWRLGVAVIVQAVCFGILHVDPVGAGVFGVCMALFYLRARTLLVPMAVHAMNNGTVFLLVMLGVGSGEEQTTSAAEAVITGALMLAISTPFIVVFIRRNWRGPDSLTPYEAYEKGPSALPPRKLAGVTVEGRPDERYRWLLGPADLVVSRNRSGSVPAWSLPYRAVTHLGATQDFARVSLAYVDGSVLTLRPALRSEPARRRAVAALQRRVPQAPIMKLR